MLHQGCFIAQALIPGKSHCWTKRLRRGRAGQVVQIMRVLRGGPCDVLACGRLAFSGRWGWISLSPSRAITMSDLRNRLIRDLHLAGLGQGTQQLYVRAVRQLAAYYMVSPDRLSERHVENYLRYDRDELGVAKGTFEPLVAGLKFFYLQTMGYDWPLFTKKRFASRGRSACPTSAAMRTAAA